MNVLIYKDGMAISEVNSRKLKSNVKPMLSFKYDELHYTPLKQVYMLNYEEQQLTPYNIEEIESFISNIEEDKDISLIKSLSNYLYETDWMVIRELETGKKIPEHIKDERKRAREKLHILKG